MLILGHRFIDSEQLYHIENIEDILHTPSNSLIYLPFSEKNIYIIKHLQSSKIRFALDVDSILELLYAENLGASFIIVQNSIAKNAQNIAETYLFDAKILVHIENELQIEPMAHEGIDGVIFSNAIVKSSS